MDSLFSTHESLDQLDPDFVRLRDGSGAESAYRERFQKLWEQYHPFCAESDFLFRIKTDFAAHAWQMIMGCRLLDLGFHLHPPHQQGPDYLIKKDGEKPIIVESTIIRPGTGEDQYPTGRTPPFYVEEEKIYLRIANALQGKYDQHRRWLKKKLIAEDQGYIVALFTGTIPDSSISSPYASHLEQCLFAANIDSLQSGSKNVEPTRERIHAVKHNGSCVHLNLFQDNTFREVSGIISTSFSIYETAVFQGSDLHFIHNPNAKNPIPIGTFKCGSESWIEHGKLHRTHWKRGFPNAHSGVI